MLLLTAECLMLNDELARSYYRFAKEYKRNNNVALSTRYEAPRGMAFTLNQDCISESFELKNSSFAYLTMDFTE